jgi:hypothetical protein
VVSVLSTSVCDTGTSKRLPPLLDWTSLALRHRARDSSNRALETLELRQKPTCTASCLSVVLLEVKFMLLLRSTAAISLRPVAEGPEAPMIGEVDTHVLPPWDAASSR